MAYRILNKKKEWAKINNNYVIGSDYFGEMKRVNMSERTLILPGTDETKDRDGDIITFSGWDFDNLNKNPVFLWAHNYESVPLARINKVIKRSKVKRHDFLMKFPTQGLNPFADMIFALYGEKMINASSIGFIPLEWEDIEEKDTKDNAALNPWITTPKKYLKKEALELSGCSIPANPNAVAEQLSIKSFGGMTVQELIKAYTEGTLEIKHKDDILEELHVEPFVIEDDKTQIQGVDIEIIDDGYRSKYIPAKSIEFEQSNMYYTMFKCEGDNYVVTISNSSGRNWDEISEEEKDKVRSQLFSDAIDHNIEEIKTTFNLPNNVIGEIEKSGAVLNKKNLSLLSGAIENIQKVLDSAKKEEPNPLNEPDDDKKDITRLTIDANAELSMEYPNPDKALEINMKIDKDQVLKPYPNEHACRLEDPNKYETFSRKNCAERSDGKCIDHIYGIKDGKSELQAMRFDKEIWTEQAAKNHCKESGGNFEAARKESVSNSLDTERKDANSNLNDDTDNNVFDAILGDENNKSSNIAPEKASNMEATLLSNGSLAIQELKASIIELNKVIKAKFK